MGIDPSWFVDERTLDLVKTYLFYRQAPYDAFPGGITEQPTIWVSAKIIMDGLLETRIA